MIGRTEFTFDDRHLQLTRTLPLGVEITSDATDFFGRSEYTDQGQQTLHVDFEGRMTEFAYGPPYRQPESYGI